MSANKRTKLEFGKTYSVVFTKTRFSLSADAEVVTITEAELTIGDGEGPTHTVRQAHGYISSWLAMGSTTAEITEVS